MVDGVRKKIATSLQRLTVRSVKRNVRNSMDSLFTTGGVTAGRPVFRAVSLTEKKLRN